MNYDRISWPTIITTKNSEYVEGQITKLREFVAMRKRDAIIPNRNLINMLRTACGNVIAVEGADLMLSLTESPVDYEIALAYALTGLLMCDYEAYAKQCLQINSRYFSEREIGKVGTRMFLYKEQVDQILSEDTSGFTLLEKFVTDNQGDELTIGVTEAARRYKQLYNHFSYLTEGQEN